MTTRLRLTAGAAALAAGLWFLSGAAAAPVLPPETYKKAAEADVAQLQKHLDHIAKEPMDAKRYGPTAKSVAMLLAAYGEATGDKGLTDQALKVAEALAKKDYKTADAEAKKLAVKAGGKPLAAGDLHKMHKYDLAEVMSPFRGGKVGGLNIEKDIRDAFKKDAPVPVDPAAVEVLAARTAVIGEYTLHFPNEKATVNTASKAQWEKWTKDMIGTSQKLIAESAKGKKADEKALVKMLNTLDTTCRDCHNKFRDD
ncbi:MAG: hypothetical protein C0501_16785 [Isosphaera sp.]|nr:hypothetical protein [Isosphaera sp.]